MFITSEKAFLSLFSRFYKKNPLTIRMHLVYAISPDTFVEHQRERIPALIIMEEMAMLVCAGTHTLYLFLTRAIVLCEICDLFCDSLLQQWPVSLISPVHTPLQRGFVVVPFCENLYL